MDAVELEQSVRAKFNDDIVVALGLPTVFENEPPPKPNEPDPKKEDLWGSVVVQMGESRQADISANPRIRHTGVLLVCLFTKPNLGTAAIMAMAGQIFTAFHPQGDAGVLYRQPSMNKGGNDGKGWYQVNVTCPFFADSF
jgi:hypothetical protein